jgi:hypothetical protein
MSEFGYTTLLAVAFAASGIIGAFVAYDKGRNPFGWFLLCAVLPIMLPVLLFLKPIHEVPGMIKRCPECGVFLTVGKDYCSKCDRQVENTELKKNAVKADSGDAEKIVPPADSVSVTENGSAGGAQD